MSVYKAMAAVMADLAKVGIGKDQQNKQQGFRYRGVDDVMNTLAPILAKHGLLIVPRVLDRQATERESRSGGALFHTVLKIEFDFIAAEDGSKHVVGPIIGEAMDSGDKAANKAMSIAYKYACFQAFCIPTEGMDPDAETHEVKARPTHAEAIRAYLEHGQAEQAAQLLATLSKDEKRAVWKQITAAERERLKVFFPRQQQTEVVQ